MRVSGKHRACVLALGILLAGSVAGAQDVLIVANKGVTVSEINAAQLREVFTGTRSRLNDGTRAVPVILKGGPVHEVFLRKHIGDSPEEFRSRWRKAVFTGQGSMPKEFSSEVSLLEYVAATPGAIGYVSRIIDGQDVKVLSLAP
jgi:ABC-type phosphate transport system substrate-binding protein